MFSSVKFSLVGLLVGLVLTNAEECEVTRADIVFVMDSSGSLKPEEWEAEKKFVQDVTNDFDIGPDKVRVGIVEFSKFATLQADFDKYPDNMRLHAGIAAVPKQDSGTRTDRALELVKTNLLPQKRDGVPLTVIVVTDGKSREPELTVKAANALKASNPTIFSVGVGRADPEELNAIATSEDHVFQFDNFDQLNKLKEQFKEKACEIVVEAATTTVPPPTTTIPPTTTVTVPAECTEHQTLENELIRSPMIISTAAQTGDVCDPDTPLKCDVNLQGWYRITPIGGAEGNVDLVWKQADLAGLFRCGTKYPIYMNADKNPLPQIKYETKSIKACLYFGPTFEEKCIDVDQAIEVTNCGEFNVYNFNLDETVPCPASYCTTTNEPCPEGTFSANGFQPGCTDEVPDFIGKPVVEFDVCNPENELTFICNRDAMNVENPDMEAVREIKWYMSNPVTGEPEVVTEFKGPLADFTEDDYKLKMGDMTLAQLGVDVRCEINAYTAGNVPGGSATSDPFFAGVTADQEQVEVQGNNEGTIKVTSTVPVVCPKDFIVDGECMANLRVSITTKDLAAVTCANGEFNGNIVIPDACGVEIPAVVPKPGECSNEAGQSTNVVFHGRLPDVYNGDAGSTITLTITKQPGYEIWQQKLPDISVNIVNTNSQTSTQVCNSQNDPHMTAFTGRKYELQQSGTFVLYKHATLPLEVQATYQRCAPPYTNAFCNCAVAVQSGRDLFVYDVCKKAVANQVVDFLRVGVLGCDNKAMNVVKNPGGSYTITLPTGTKVWIARAATKRGKTFIGRITITASTADFGIDTIGGVCGVIGNGRGRELKMKDGGIIHNVRSFYQSWKIEKDADNLILNPHVVEDNSFSMEAQCECKATTADPTKFEAVCSPAAGGTKCKLEGADESVLRVCNDGKRKRRDLADFDIFADTVKLPEETGDIGPKRPCPDCFPVGWTRPEAEEFCSNYLNDNSPETCMDLETVKTDFLLEGCVADIKAIGETEFAIASLQAVLADCENELVSNNTVIVTVDPENPPTKPLPIAISPEAKALLKDICPGACNMRGKCNAGKCDCESDFGGDDCSVNLKAAPTHLFLLGNGVCDLQARDCLNTVVYGTEISTILPVTCKITEFIFNGQKKIESGQYTSPAEVMTEGQVVCPVKRKKAGKSAYIYDIALANGEFASESTEMVAFDSNCYDVDKDGADKTPKVKDGMCVIDSVCHAAGAVNAKKAKQTCQPEKNKFGWTRKATTPTGPQSFRDCFEIPKKRKRERCFKKFMATG